MPSGLYYEISNKLMFVKTFNLHDPPWSLKIEALKQLIKFKKSSLPFKRKDKVLEAALIGNRW